MVLFKDQNGWFVAFLFQLEAQIGQNEANLSQFKAQMGQLEAQFGILRLKLADLWHTLGIF